jgi:hypothetical protein
MEGAGEADRRDDEPKDDRRLWDVGGGFIGRARDCGVPGAEGPTADGAGDPALAESCETKEARLPKSGGAGLFEDTRRAGMSIFDILPC